MRSALYGAADADGNGRVDYREVAAFVQQANASIPNDKYRSSVFARPPRYSPVLVDLRPRKERALEVGGRVMWQSEDLVDTGLSGAPTFLRAAAPRGMAVSSTGS